MAVSSQPPDQAKKKDELSAESRELLYTGTMIAKGIELL
jgi:hypothetical protein